LRLVKQVKRWLRVALPFLHFLLWSILEPYQLRKYDSESVSRLLNKISVALEKVEQVFGRVELLIQLKEEVLLILRSHLF
jgi:hypothetical protein